MSERETWSLVQYCQLFQGLPEYTKEPNTLAPWLSRRIRESHGAPAECSDPESRTGTVPSPAILEVECGLNSAAHRIERHFRWALVPVVVSTETEDGKLVSKSVKDATSQETFSEAFYNFLLV